MKQIIPWMCAVVGLVALALGTAMAQSPPPAPVEGGLVCNSCKQQMDRCRDFQHLGKRATCESEARACRCPR